MPLFFFEYCDDDGGVDPDTDGVEFPDIKTAYIDAYHSAIDMWAEARHLGSDLSRRRIKIRNASGRIVGESPFAEIFGRE